MHKKDLLRFLSDEAEELIGRAEYVSPEVAESFRKEAEELLTLRHNIAVRTAGVFDVKEAA